jgi:hypothetical protein
MSMIKTRIAKLEETNQEASPALRPPGIPADAMAAIRATALLCPTAHDLVAYLTTLEDEPTDLIVSLEERRRSDAARSAFARSVFEEAHGPVGAAA